MTERFTKESRDRPCEKIDHSVKGVGSIVHHVREVSEVLTFPTVVGNVDEDPTDYSEITECTHNGVERLNNILKVPMKHEFDFYSYVGTIGRIEE